MKSGKGIFIVLAVILFSYLNMQADCYYPYQQYSFTGNYDGCEYICYICSKTDSTYPFDQTSYIDRIEVLNINCSDMFEDPLFWEEVNENVLLTLMNDASWPPCSNETYEFLIKSARCWKIIHDHVDNMLTMKNCGYDAYCLSTYEVCTDYNKNPPENKWTMIGKSVISTPGCSGNGVPDLPPSGKTWSQDWETDCFILDCY